jgi:hypothetical protein
MDSNKYGDALVMLTNFVKDDLLDRLLANHEVMKALRVKLLLSGQTDLETLEAVDREIELTSKVISSIPQEISAVTRKILGV